ncbi:MAG: hypothetical protein V1691_01075 [Chloroflexota bacterium]
MITITCPDCGTEGKMSLSQAVFEGPYRCWKCHQFFTIRIENNELKQCTPLSQEEFDRWQEIQSALKRMKKGSDD